MKKVILTSLIISITLITIIIYDRAMAHQWSFGTNSIIAISILAGWFLFSFISFIFYQTDKRQAIAKMWLSIASPIMVFLIVDLIAGFFLIQRLSPKMMPDQFVHHKLIPNTYSKFETGEYNYIQRINNIGMRGSDIQMIKKPDTYRIIMLGDSFTMGYGVSDDHTFSFLLEESLNGKSGTINSKHFEILNAGVDSYSPILSFIQLTKIAGPLELDLVVLNFDMSDLIQEVAYRNAASYGADGEITGVAGREEKVESMGFSLTLAARNWVDQNLYVTRLILFYLDEWTKEPNEYTIRNTVILGNPETLTHTLSEDKADRREQWQNIFDSILKIKKYCDDEDISFLLTIYPWGHQVNEKEWVPGRSGYIPDDSLVSDRSVHIIEEFAATNNIQLLNVFPAFRSYSSISPLYFNYNMHWTPTGHKVVAQELERFIEATYFSNSN